MAVGTGGGVTMGMCATGRGEGEEEMVEGREKEERGTTEGGVGAMDRVGIAGGRHICP